MRKHIAGFFDKQKKEFGLDTYDDLFKKKSKKEDDDGYLRKWLLDCKEKSQISDEEYENKISYLDRFDKFITYFVGFRENRDNMFSEKQQTTAISFRIADENMKKYFNNCRIYSNICKNHSDLATELKHYEEYFVPENYSKYFSQSGIDKYNEIIGHGAEDKHARGINQKINEYRQKTNEKIPIMSKLFKQILSDIDGSFMNQIENDKELFEMVKQTYDSFIKLICQMKNLVNKSVCDNSGG